MAGRRHAERDAAPRLTAWHPSIDELVAANRAILANQDGIRPRQNLRDRGFLEHALNQACALTATDSSRDAKLAAAADLAHGIGEAQAFIDGNHRTGYLACKTFLHNNGLGDLSPIDRDDDELAEHLQHGLIKSQPDPPRFVRADTIELLRARLSDADSNGAR